jgi:hypothetical protein
MGAQGKKGRELNRRIELTTEFSKNSEGGIQRKDAKAHRKGTESMAAKDRKDRN